MTDPAPLQAARSTIDELVELVHSHACGEGKLASALPGVWLFRWDRPRPMARARSQAMSVSMAVQGKKLLRVEGRELVYDPLSYLVLRGDTVYQSAPIEASPAKPYLAISICLSPQLVTQALLELTEAGHPLQDAATPSPAFTAPLDEPLIDGMARLLRTLHDPIERRLLGPLVVREIVFRLLLSNASVLMRHVALAEGEREPIRRAMAFIEERALERLSVEVIARHVGMSASHFAHRFSAVASVSPMRYQKHVRLERAREMLLSERGRAGEVAGRVGYASEAHFTRDFKRQFGLAPASYARAFERNATALITDARDTAGSSKKIAEPAMGMLGLLR